MRLYSILSAIVVAAGLTTAPASAQDEDYLLATATTGGTYYPVGVALATLVKVKLQPSDGINMSAVNSAGSAENVKLLRDDEVQFAIVLGLYGAYAAQGIGELADVGPQENMRSITMLWPNVEHFVIRKEDAKTGTIQDVIDMQGRRAAFGRQNSGGIGSTRELMRGLGIDMDESYELVYTGYQPSADAMQNGQIDAMNLAAGPPVSAVASAFAAIGDDLALLGFTDEEIERANANFEGLWTPYIIPAGTYPNQDEDVRTMSQPNFLAVNADVPEDTVYKITKTIFENLPFLNSIHPATKSMGLDVAVDGLPVKLHPGALRYYEEVGVEVPDRLR